MAALMVTVVGASLLGSLHCAGMCGALVAFAVGTPDAGRRRTDLHVLYHGGRLVMYSLIGAIFGLVGAALDMGGAMIGFQRVAAFGAGGLMVLVGIYALLQHTSFRMPHFQMPGPLRNGLMRAQRTAAALQPAPRAATIGLLSGLLPCGWLYVFAITAAGTGSALWGAAVMAAFWVGTVPVLLSVGVGTQWLAGLLGKRLPLVTSVAIIAIGIFTIAGRISIPASAFDAIEPVALETPAEAVKHVEALSKQPLPCCPVNGH